jgi:hypothetical protein
MSTAMEKLRYAHEAEGIPRRLYHADGATDEQIKHLEGLVPLALRLAAVLRDEDATIVWGQLARMPEREVRELCVIALACVPVEMTRRQLLGWVERMGERA